jgi:hypothetical protein
MSPQRTEAITAQQPFAPPSSPLSPEVTVRVLLFAAGCLIVASLAGQCARYLWRAQNPWGLVRLFDVNAEGNVPTWFSSSMLLVCALLLGRICAAKKGEGAREARYWGGLALIFLGLSMDETASFHELTITPLRSALQAGGVLFFTWVVPGAVFLLAFVVTYLRFFLQLPPLTRRGFLIAGAIYVGGALGMELVGGYHAAAHGQFNLGFSILTTVEEFGEMLGIILFIRALLLYMDTHLKAVRIPLREEG